MVLMRISKLILSGIDMLIYSGKMGKGRSEDTVCNGFAKT